MVIFKSVLNEFFFPQSLLLFNFICLFLNELHLAKTSFRLFHHVSVLIEIEGRHIFVITTRSSLHNNLRFLGSGAYDVANIGDFLVKARLSCSLLLSFFLQQFFAFTDLIGS